MAIINEAAYQDAMKEWVDCLLRRGSRSRAVARPASLPLPEPLPTVEYWSNGMGCIEASEPDTRPALWLRREEDRWWREMVLAVGRGASLPDNDCELLGVSDANR